MEKNKGIAQKKTLSKWQTLLRFPNSLFMVEQSLRSREIRGQKVELDKFLNQAIEINKFIILGNQIRDDFNRQRVSLINESVAATQIEDYNETLDLFSLEDFNDNDVDEFFQDDIDDLFINRIPEIKDDKLSDDSKQPKIMIKNITDITSELSNIKIDTNDVKDWMNLIEIQGDTYVEAEVFPKGYHCWQCGHYNLFSSVYHGDLKCHCCNKSRMDQEALIFMCPICADMSPIHPWWERDLQIIRNKIIQCPDNNCPGHIHFFLNTNDLMKSNWYCNICRTNFIYKSEIFGRNKERRLVLYCDKCGVYSKIKEHSLRIPMNLKPTTAKLLTPLIYEAISVDNKTLNEENLKYNLKSLKDNKDSLYWNLKDNSILSILIKNKFAIKNIFLVKNIKTFNAIVGYQSSLSNNLKINPIPNFFKYGEKYNVYFFEHIGNGLVIKLDKEKLIHNFSKIKVQNDRNYSEIIEILIDRLNNGKIQVIMNDKESNEFKLFKALHTFKHILLKNISKKIGLESFRGKVLLRDGLILLYEVEDISTGGLYQLTLQAGSRIELLELLLECENDLSNCIHDCVDFCKQCSFIDDFYCRPFLNEEVFRWIPSNSFVSRMIAKNLILI